MRWRIGRARAIIIQEHYNRSAIVPDNCQESIAISREGAVNNNKNLHILSVIFDLQRSFSVLLEIPSDYVSPNVRLSFCNFSFLTGSTTWKRLPYISRYDLSLLKFFVQIIDTNYAGQIARRDSRFITVYI